MLDRIFMLFLYENREKQFPINFSSPHMRQTNMCNFTSSWIQNRARWETGDGGPVTSIQECCFCRFQCFCCAMEENMVLRCVVHNKNTETRKSGVLVLTSQAHYPSFPSCAVLYRCIQPKMELYVFVRLIQGEEKLIGNFFLHFHTRTT